MEQCRGDMSSKAQTLKWHLNKNGVHRTSVSFDLLHRWIVCYCMKLKSVVCEMSVPQNVKGPLRGRRTVEDLFPPAVSSGAGATVATDAAAVYKRGSPQTHWLSRSRPGWHPSGCCSSSQPRPRASLFSLETSTGLREPWEPAAAASSQLLLQPEKLASLSSLKQ